MACNRIFDDKLFEAGKLCARANVLHYGPEIKECNVTIFGPAYTAEWGKILPGPYLWLGHIDDVRALHEALGKVVKAYDQEFDWNDRR